MIYYYNMTNRLIWNAILEAASSVYDPDEARSVARIILEDSFNIPLAEVFTDPDRKREPTGDDIRVIVQQIRSSKPVQYITGRTEFCGMEMLCPEGVLIPRPETEDLVNLIISRHGDRSPRILDIGTGSGCIAVSLAKLIPGAEVAAIDISDNALRTASENAARNEVSVKLRCVDILSESPGGEYDLIVSNPPYVTGSEKVLMSENVLNYEPHTALFVPDDDPLLFYRVIACRATTLLRAGGVLYFEINSRLGSEVSDLLRNEGYCDVTLVPDRFDRPRIVYGWLKK